MIVKVFHLISVVNETRFLVQHESCDCKCQLNENVYKNKNGIMTNVAVSVNN